MGLSPTKLPKANPNWLKSDFARQVPGARSFRSLNSHSHRIGLAMFPYSSLISATRNQTPARQIVIVFAGVFVSLLFAGAAPVGAEDWPGFHGLVDCRSLPEANFRRDGSGEHYRWTLT